MYASMFTCTIQTYTTYIYKCSHSDTYIHASIRSEIRPLVLHDRQDSGTLFVQYTYIDKSLKSKIFMNEEFFFFPVPSTSSLSSESPGQSRRKEGRDNLGLENLSTHLTKMKTILAYIIHTYIHSYINKQGPCSRSFYFLF